MIGAGRSSLEGSQGAPGRGGHDPGRKGKSGGRTCTPRRVDYALTMQARQRGERTRCSVLKGNVHMCGLEVQPLARNRSRHDEREQLGLGSKPEWSRVQARPWGVVGSDVGVGRGQSRCRHSRRVHGANPGVRRSNKSRRYLARRTFCPHKL